MGEASAAAMACLEAARALRAVVWDISQKYSVKGLPPPDELVGRIDGLKLAAGTAAAKCAEAIEPFVVKLAAMHNEPVVVGRVKATSWHEAALRIGRNAAGWRLGAEDVKSYFLSRIDPESKKLRARRSETAATDGDTDLNELMASVEHHADEMEPRLRIEAAKLVEGGAEAWTQATDLQRKLIAALRKSGPLKGDSVARAVGREPAGSVRGELRHMEQLGWIRLGPEGYEAVV